MSNTRCVRCLLFLVQPLILISRSWKNVHGKLSSAQYLGSIIIIGQIINLIFNLSPDIVPQYQLVRTKYVQALLLATAVLTLCGCTPLVRGEGTWRIAETATLFAPLLVSFASCLMKRSEVDMENQLKELEGKRYKMKGA